MVGLQVFVGWHRNAGLFQNWRWSGGFGWRGFGVDRLGQGRKGRTNHVESTPASKPKSVLLFKNPCPNPSWWCNIPGWPRFSSVAVRISNSSSGSDLRFRGKLQFRFFFSVPEERLRFRFQFRLLPWHSNPDPPTLAFGKKARETPKRASVFLFAEPLKSLEKEGKTHKKA